MCKKSNVKKQNKSFKDCAAFINMPISKESEDKVGILQYALELKDAIDKGAQTIAITSDFGGGKSSLVKYFESFYTKIGTKFCYVNLWCDLNNTTSNEGLIETHKSFIYQLANQISNRKGHYVSKRLSKNYGLVKLSLQNAWLSTFSYIMCIFIIIGLLSVTLYDKITSKIFDQTFFVNNHNIIGICAFGIAIIIGLFIIYKADIVFSFKQSESGREINQHELMDIYKSYICNFHFKHYIVIIEDLDRSSNKEAMDFIKQLRRYYVPYKSNTINSNFLNNIYKKIGLFNRNRITFIVNIKSEATLDDSWKGLYEKIFDYILNLKTINIDNYDTILKSFLEDNKDFFKKNNIPMFNANDEIIPEIEWLKRGEDLNIRELKNRLNNTISTYTNLCSKFDQKNISLKKCIASAYIISRFPKECSIVKNIGFDDMIDLYVADRQVTVEEIMEKYKDKNISEDLVNELIKLVKNNLIESDYKQYFFNYPIGSYLYNNDENRLISTLLYDIDVTTDKDFDFLVSSILNNNKNILFSTFERLKKLSVSCPKCIFQSKNLLDFAISNFSDMVWETLKNELSYDEESIYVTSKILIDIIKNSFYNDDRKIDHVCKIIIDKGTPHSIIYFRKTLIEEFNSDILKFKILYSDECPLITKSELALLKDFNISIKLINFNSSEITIELITTIHNIILTELNLHNEADITLIEAFYINSYRVLGKSENTTLTNFIFEFLIKNKTILNELEAIIMNNNDFNEIRGKYLGLLCLVAEYGALSSNSLAYVKKFNIKSGLNESVCRLLYENGYYDMFIANSCNTNINLIDFSNEIVVDELKKINFYDENTILFEEQTLLRIRKSILNQDISLALTKYRYLFFGPNTIITDNELKLIADRTNAIKLINTEDIDENNCQYICNYFNKESCALNVSYEVLKFICSIKNIKMKKIFFSSIDFDQIPYCRLSASRKKEILSSMSDSFDFSKIEEQIEYMTTTKCTNIEFEKSIKLAISNKAFTGYEKKYVTYVSSLKKISNETINNLCNIKTIYIVPPNVQEKLYDCKKYEYYVCSKTRYYEEFIFETDKIDVLLPVYLQIFLSDENLYQRTKPYMIENRKFIEYLIEQDKYKGLSEYKRNLFKNAIQSTNSLKDLFYNYTVMFCISYLKGITGFKDRTTAEYFLSEIKKRKDIAASREVYDNIYDLLPDYILKGKYTRYHNNAKSK